MGTAFRFLLIAISFLSISNRTYADPVGDTAGVQAGVILEANEIDSSTVEVGAFAVVIYGMGKKGPISGVWESLITARGYIQSVDAEMLTLAVGQKSRPQRIALERLQRLVLVGASSKKSSVRGSTQEDTHDDTRADSAAVTVPFVGSAAGNSTQEKGSGHEGVVSNGVEKGVWAMYSHSGKGRVDARETSNRIAKKLRAGALWGAAFGLVSGSLMAVIISPGGDGLGQPVVFPLFGLLGSTVGTAVGVSRVDPADRHDQFVPSLMGSVLGNVTGVGLASMTRNRNALLVCPVVSVVLAVWLSEVSRSRLPEHTSRLLGDPPKSPNSLSVWASPTGHMLAIAKLRF